MYIKMFEEVINEEVILSEIEDELKLYQYLDAIYHHIMEYIGMNEFSIAMYIKTLLDDEIIEIKNKTNREIVIAIRDDILYYLKKDMNYCLFKDRDID